MRRVLLVTPFPPRTDAGHGGGRLIAEEILHLARRAEVGLVCLRADEDGPAGDDVVEACAFVEEVPRHPVGLSLAAAVRERRRIALRARRLPAWAVGLSVAEARRRVRRAAETWAPDVVQVEMLPLADVVTALPRERPPVVVVEHDARPPARLGSAAAWRRLRHGVAPRVDAFVAFSDGDRAAVLADLPGARVAVIRPGLELPPAPLGPGAAPEVLFVGGFRHPPNVDAARRLAGEILPLVRQDVPEAELVIVGAGAPPDLARPGVRLTGLVADLEPLLRQAAVSVAPLAEGGGVRIKVVEALAAGKAVVASRRATEGLDLRDGDQLLVADGDRETAAAVIALLQDESLRSRLGASARAWAEQSLSWDAAIDRLDELYAEVVRAGARTP